MGSGRSSRAIANDVAVPGAGFGTDTNRVTMLTRTGVQQEPHGSKHEVARGALELLLVSAR